MTSPAEGTATAGRRGGLAPLALLVPPAVALAAGLPILHLAANRLVTGTAVPASALGARGLIAAGLGAALLGRGRPAAVLSLAAFTAALALGATGLDATAAGLLDGQPPAARARLASGAWIALTGLVGGAAAAGGRLRLPGGGGLGLALPLAVLGGLAGRGALDHLSLMIEARARGPELGAAVAEHAALSSAALALAVAACLGLAPWRRARGGVDLVAAGLQVVPAVALLGVLVALASGLLAALPSLRGIGLSALGPGPAVLGIAAYLLLPLWRGLHAGLAAPDPASLDAATALGLTPRQILVRLRLPLGAPILVGALRVAAVQSLGLATLGALVGAGGLGAIVFDGMAQFAPDLILLGALPIVGLSLAAEGVLGRIEAALAQRRPG